MQNMPKTSAYAEAMLTVLLMSTVPIVIRGISADPWVIGISRLFIAALFLWLTLRRRTWWGGLSVGERRGLVIIGGTFALHWMSYFWSIKLASAQIATIGVSTYGIFVSVLGAIFLGHRIQWIHVAGLLLALAGTWLVVGGIDWQAEISTRVLMGFLSGIVAGFFYALLPIFHQTFKHLPTGSRTMGQFLFALCFFLPFAPAGDWQLNLGDLAGLLYLGLIGTVVCHTLWIRATTTLPTTHSGIIYYLYVPSGCLLGFVILGERLAPLQIAGACLILLGSVIGIAARRPQPPAPSSKALRL